MSVPSEISVETAESLAVLPFGSILARQCCENNGRKWEGIPGADLAKVQERADLTALSLSLGALATLPARVIYSREVIGYGRKYRRRQATDEQVLIESERGMDS